MTKCGGRIRISETIHCCHNTDRYWVQFLEDSIQWSYDVVFFTISRMHLNISAMSRHQRRGTGPARGGNCKKQSNHHHEAAVVPDKCQINHTVDDDEISPQPITIPFSLNYSCSSKTHPKRLFSDIEAIVTTRSHIEVPTTVRLRAPTWIP